MRFVTTYFAVLLCCCLMAVAATFISCKKMVSVDLPIDKITTATVFSSDESATSAVVGLYSQMIPASLYYSSGATSVYAGLSADELTLTSATIPEEVEFEQNRLSPANGTIGFNFWPRMYKLLYQANACIENLEASTALSPAIKQRLLGEAKFVRAFHYFYLVNLFGDVPLITTTDYRVTATAPRSPAGAVYDQVINDLKEATALLPEAYAGSGRIRPNKWAAEALLARTYLYRQDWPAAEAEASTVIGSGAYSLAPNPANAFLATSTETVWQLMPVESGFNTTEARYFVPTTAATTKPSYALTTTLVNAFESNDARKGAWVGSKIVSGQTYYYPFKYKVRNLNLPVTENYIVLRLGELLLIRAEARAQQNNLSAARADLNTIRSRAALASSAAADKITLLTAIEAERRIELFAEWGHRWLDIKRTGRIDAVMAAAKPSWQSYAALFPIPQSELLKNPFLTQNPGYQ